MDRARTARTYLALLVLVALSLLGNVLAPRLFMGFNYLFGSIPALIVLRYYGIFWGTLAGVVAASWTYVLFGHPYAMVWLTVEPIFIGLLLRRGKPQNLVLYNTLYWPLLGIPLLWVFFKYVMGLPFVGTLPAALMFWFIGITNSLCAEILMEWLPLARWVGRPEMERPISIRQAMFHLMMIIVLLPAIVVMVINGRGTLADSRRAIVDRALESSRDLGRQVETTITQMERQIDEMLSTIDSDDVAELKKVGEHLIEHHWVQALWLLSPEGRVRLLGSREGVPFQAPSAEVRAGESFQPYLGPGRESLILRRHLDQAGDLVAAMDLMMLRRSLVVGVSLKTPRWVILTDRDGQVIISSRPGLDSGRVYGPRRAGLVLPGGGQVFQVLPPMDKYITLWSRVQRSWFATEVDLGGDLDLRLILEIPFAPYQADLLTRQSYALIMLLLLSLLTLGLSRFFSQRISEPIMTLAQATTDLPERIYDQSPLDWPQSRLAEISALAANFRLVAQALAQRFAEVHEAKETLEDRVRARTEELRQAKEQAELVFRLVPSAVIAVDLDRRVVIWNQTAADLTGWPSSEIMGQRCEVFCVAQARTGHCPLEAEGLSMPVMQRECRIIHRDGHEITVLKNLDYLRDVDGRVVGVIESFEDLTQRQEMEGQLRHAQKMEAIGTLTGGLAHDFNNLLSIVCGYAELMETDLGSLDPHQRYIRQILEATDRAKSLTHNLLAYSRPAKPHLQALDLNQAVAQAATLLGRLLPETIDLQVELSPEPLTIRADQAQLSQVLMNLITNARDAIVGHGNIVITVDRGLAPPEGPGREWAVVRVSDDGQGMDRETRERVFEPFFSTKGIGEGTGLGLAISFGILKEHGGAIELTSRPGQGSTFQVNLPLVEGVEVPAVPVRPAEGDLRGRGETILLAEDEAPVRHLLEELLGQNGYEVLSAPDGQSAVEIAASAERSIDLAILDVIMPRLNGRQVAEALWRERSGLPVIFISGYTADHLGREIEGGQGPYQLMHKPLVTDELLAAIRQALGRRQA